MPTAWRSTRKGTSSPPGLRRAASGAWPAVEGNPSPRVRLPRRVATTGKSSTPPTTSPCARTASSTSPIPTFGSGSQGFPAQSLALANAQGVYRLDQGGALHLEDSSTSGPNGVSLSPDEKTLYVAYTASNSLAKFNVAADGSLSGKQTFVTGATLADSTCVDAGGNVYVGTSSGLAVFSPEGKALGTRSPPEGRS